MVENSSGVLFIIGTPIGNLKDITLRALDTLKDIDLIAAEDTRQTKKLLNHFSIIKPIVSYHEHNKYSKGPGLVQELKAGKNIGLVSDAGMPGISDPGADLVQACIEEDIKITVIPGPSALITGLVASGLDTNGFIFAGFFPRSSKERKKVLESLGQEQRTIIFYESPRRLLGTLEIIRNSWGDRQCCIARELTKLYEEFQRGRISEILSAYEIKTVKGEITLLLEGKTIREDYKPSWEIIESYYLELIGEGKSRKEAVKEAAKHWGVSKRELYNRVMK